MSDALIAELTRLGRYWNQRYVETARQAKVDIAARDEYRRDRDALLVAAKRLRAENAALRAAVDAVVAMCGDVIGVEDHGESHVIPPTRRHLALTVLNALLGSAHRLTQPEAVHRGSPGAGLDEHAGGSHA